MAKNKTVTFVLTPDQVGGGSITLQTDKGGAYVAEEMLGEIRDWAKKGGYKGRIQVTTEAVANPDEKIRATHPHAVLPRCRIFSVEGEKPKPANNGVGKKVAEADPPATNTGPKPTDPERGEDLTDSLTTSDLTEGLINMISRAAVGFVLPHKLDLVFGYAAEGDGAKLEEFAISTADRLVEARSLAIVNFLFGLVNEEELGRVADAAVDPVEIALGVTGVEREVLAEMAFELVGDQLFELLDLRLAPPSEEATLPSTAPVQTEESTEPPAPSPDGETGDTTDEGAEVAADVAAM